MELAAKIKKIREDKGWSQLKAAKAVGVSASTYRDWEAGRKIPADALPQLSLAFETSISQLLGMRQEANVELAEALACFYKGLEHVKKALSQL